MNSPASKPPARPEHRAGDAGSPGDPTPETAPEDAGRNIPPPAVSGSAAGDIPGSEEDAFARMGLREHLSELRNRILRCLIGIIAGFLICFNFADFLYAGLTAPLERAMPAGSYMVFLGIPEGFLVELRIAFVAGIFLSSPYVFYQIWAFVAPGLYREERRMILPLAILSAFFFIAGAAFCYCVVFPVAFTFFLGFSREALRATPAAGAYLSFAIQLLVVFGLVFEMPLFAFFLAKLGLISAKLLRAIRKYAILASFILAAILTPPDAFSQLLMAIPLLLLYEISIFVAAIAQKSTPDTGKKNSRPSGEGDTSGSQV